ncbi:MAG TPA: hypothetical protein VJQ84_01760 [Solirubrobacterales bacterium]|nr:hypothetical protein [Solirubrobacterales bacterium]
MGTSDNSAEAVVNRIAELVDPGVRWQRSLWNTGLVLSLKEIVEASDAVGAGALNPASVKWLADSAKGRVTKDPGAGSAIEQKAIATLLTRDLSSGGANYLELLNWIAAIEDAYLERWIAAVSSTEDRPSRETSARALSAYLLDQGFSPTALTAWLKSLPIAKTEDLFEAARSLVAASGEDYEVLILFEKPPPARIARPSEWRDAKEASSWLLAQGFEPRRQHGGLLLSIHARDASSAANLAADVVDRLLARVSVGMRDTVRVSPSAFVRGVPTPVALRRVRKVEVRALEREDRLLFLDRSGPVDDALELVSHLNGAPAPVAVTGGWSAIESLLSGAGDTGKVVTAERFAYLVACSWPRAELTTLAWARQKQEPSDALGESLAASQTNRERCQVVLDHLGSEGDLGLEAARDRLGQRRIEKLVKEPRSGLQAIQRQTVASLRRLYRQRNLVVHGGQVAGEALSATLRTVAPLVGAGLDRITHAYLTEGTEALDLAARARFEVERAGSAGAPPSTALLE